MNWLGSLQQLGRAVMLPTMVLPAAAILLSVGSLPWNAWGLGVVGEVSTVAGHGIFIFAVFVRCWRGAWTLQPGRASGTRSAGWYRYL